jgi:hypothetical protein
MNRYEKGFVVFYFLYILIYVPCFILFVSFRPNDFLWILPFHFFGMAIGVAMLVIVFRDLYKRDFPNPNSKLTWAILMLMLWPSILVYLYKYGFRPRIAKRS